MLNSQTNKVVICFAGDSGDGIQLIGNQFSDISVVKSGNDVYTFVDYPSEIRAPAGSISGVSGFQVTISSKKIYSSDNKVDLLVIFNPAALKVNLEKLKDGGFLLIDSDSFNDKNLKKAGFSFNPLYSDLLANFKLISVPMTSLTYNNVNNIVKVVSKAKRCKNFFALGMVCWLYDRDLDGIISWLKKKFVDSEVFYANSKALKAGYDYCSTLELPNNQILIPSIDFYKDDDHLIKISGNKAFAVGAIACSFLFKMPLFSANYPITPASDIFHELINYANNNIKIFQLEDEIAAINAVIGAAYGGSLAFTCTSGPGLDLMQEGLGLAIMAELPILVLDIQRCGPSTGIPTKSEQTDLFSAVFGRHGESSAIVLAPNSPSDCFWTIIEGFCLSIFSLSPVIILSDANLANSSELWKVPTDDEIYKKIKFDFELFFDRNFNFLSENDFFSKLKWNIPGKSDEIKCIGGLERDIFTGNVSHDSLNHSSMVNFRLSKIRNLAPFLDKVSVIGDSTGDLLVITWGSVFGVVRSVYEDMYISKNKKFSVICLRYINPFPDNLGFIIKSFKKIVVIEENMGQLAFLLRSIYSVNIFNVNQVTGKPFDFLFVKEKIFGFLYE